MLQEIIHIPENLIIPIDEICQQKHISREEFFLQAAQKELISIKKMSLKFANRKAFGLWKGKDIGDIELKEKMHKIKKEKNKDEDKFFDLWKNNGIKDSVEYIRKLRQQEWENKN